MSSRKDHGPNYPAGPYMLVSFEEENQKGRTRYSVEMNVREARELMEGIEDFLAKYDAGGESKA